jgi:hypothetical protein
VIIQECTDTVAQLKSLLAVLQRVVLQLLRGKPVIVKELIHRNLPMSSNPDQLPPRFIVVLVLCTKLPDLWLGSYGFPADHG